MCQVLGTFRELEEYNILSSHMNDAVKEVSRAGQAFEAKESAPGIAGMIHPQGTGIMSWFHFFYQNSCT